MILECNSTAEHTLNIHERLRVLSWYLIRTLWLGGNIFEYSGSWLYYLVAKET